jgi:hypothetical protein
MTKGEHAAFLLGMRTGWAYDDGVRKALGKASGIAVGRAPTTVITKGIAPWQPAQMYARGATVQWNGGVFRARCGNFGWPPDHKATWDRYPS